MSLIRRWAVGLLVAGMCVIAPIPAGAAAASSDGAACEVTYQAFPHRGGFNARLMVQNTGTATIAGWTLRFPLGEGVEIVAFFDGELISGSGEGVLRNGPHNGTLEPDQSITVGFLATGAATGTPSLFSLNGVVCTIGA